MMNRDYFVDLTKETLFAPRNAASRILELNLPSQSLWMILVLMTVLNAIAYSASLYLSPPADPATMAMVPPIFRSPLLFSMALGGALVLTVFALTWIGQSMGGSGRLVDILALMTWLQVLRFALQLVVAVLMLVAPFLGGILVLVASVWGLVILVVFIDSAHGFANLFKATGVLITTVFAIVVGLSVILGVIGAAVFAGVS
ncbi:YIP1 family protein [Pseudohalocynthiibacter aestuariivivens]|nr:Yip1 family protein [Pseudohalocynthiibacter aestuariivivens]QIE44253.1 YIP1 family protein [Pseudohalocynthiibacter aestuariivivens]